MTTMRKIITITSTIKRTTTYIKLSTGIKILSRSVRRRRRIKLEAATSTSTKAIATKTTTISTRTTTTLKRGQQE